MRRILVVDDDQALRGALHELLVGEGYAVRCACDGAEALEAVAAAPLDLIVSDLSMPRVDGLTLLHTLRAWGLAIPVVLMSAAVRRAPAPDVVFLAKPFDVERLLAEIARLLEEGLDERAGWG